MAKSSIQMLATAIAKKNNLSNADAIKFVETMFNIIIDELKNSNPVKIKGLGTFKLQSVKPRESVNVNTGERVLIEGHDKISFTPDQAMKDIVNKPFAQFDTVVLNDGVEFEDENDQNEDNTENDEECIEEDNVKIPLEKTLKEKSAASSSDTAIDIKENAEICEKSCKESPILSSAKPSNDNAISKLDKNKDDFSKKDADEALYNEEKILNDKITSCQNTTESLQKEDSSVLSDKIIQKVTEEKNKDITATDNCIEKEEPTDDEREMRSLCCILLIVLIIAIIAFGGYYVKTTFYDQSFKKEIVKDNTIKNIVKPVKFVPKHVDSSSVHRVITSKKKSAKIKKIPEESRYESLSNDPKIRYGAYNIIGIEKVVVLKSGDSMTKYSRRTLGPDMLGYFQVLNGVDEMYEGDTMKVPKVRYRPQYQKKRKERY